jgi:hypothetical protein
LENSSVLKLVKRGTQMAAAKIDQYKTKTRGITVDCVFGISLKLFVAARLPDLAKRHVTP